MSFKSYLESQGKSKSTVKHYSTYAMDFLAWLDRDNTEPEPTEGSSRIPKKINGDNAQNATAKEALSYLNHLQRKGLENKTRSIRLGVIKQFFNWQIELGHRTENPVQHLKIRGSKQQKLYPILDKQQLEAIYNSYQVPGEEDERKNRNWFRAYRLGKQRNKSILSLIVNQGLTTPEIENLTVNDLRLKEGKIYIAGSRKSNERTLELKSNQIIELMEYTLQVRQLFIPYQADPETKRLFLSLPIAGQSKAAESLMIWKGLTKEIKHQNTNFINFKQVRASVVTHWLKLYNLRQVQYMAGHRYVSSTEAYLVNNTEDLQKDIDRFYPF